MRKLDSRFLGNDKGGRFHGTLDFRFHGNDSLLCRSRENGNPFGGSTCSMHKFDSPPIIEHYVTALHCSTLTPAPLPRWERGASSEIGLSSGFVNINNALGGRLLHGNDSLLVGAGLPAKLDLLFRGCVKTCPVSLRGGGFSRERSVATLLTKRSRGVPRPAPGRRSSGYPNGLRIRMPATMPPWTKSKRC